MFKVIRTSNYNFETVDDVFICGNVTKQVGNMIADALNDKYSGDESDDYYMCVESDYILHKFKGY